MNLQPPSSDNWIETVFFTILAGFAGLMGYLMRNANDRRIITWERSVLETFASGFIGFLTVLLCRAMTVPYEWTGFIAGVLGWLGATATMQLFERIVRRKLGIENVDLGEPKKSGSEDSADSPVCVTTDNSDVVCGTPTDSTRPVSGKD